MIALGDRDSLAILSEEIAASSVYWKDVKDATMIGSSVESG